MNNPWDKYYSMKKENIDWGYHDPDKHILDFFEHYGFRGDLKILDAGCGNGKNAKFLIGRGFDLHLLDISGDAISQAKERFKESDDITFYVDDILNLRETGFDVIYDYIYR